MPHWLCHCHSHRAQRLPGLCLALTLSEFLSHSLLPRTCYWHHPEAMACYDHPRDHYVSPERLGCFFSVSRSLFRRLVSFLTFDNKISQARLAVFPKHKPLSDLETQMEESPPEMLARDLTLPRSNRRGRERVLPHLSTQVGRGRRLLWHGTGLLSRRPENRNHCETVLPRSALSFLCFDFKLEDWVRVSFFFFFLEARSEVRDVGEGRPKPSYCFQLREMLLGQVENQICLDEDRRTGCAGRDRIS